MFYSEIKDPGMGGSRECIFRALRGTILKIHPLGANHGGTFVVSVYVSVCPLNSWFVIERADQST